jgi:3D (Asp-Asp-Asp) domain-containing protein
MTVRGVSESGSVTCQVLGVDGAVMTLGTFDLVDGSGSWSAPGPAGLAQDTGVRLIDANGEVVASAPFI